MSNFLAEGSVAACEHRLLTRPRTRSDPRPGEWAAWMTRLWFDGPKGPACADVVRRFVAGEIGDDRPDDD
ncbi:MAG: hypothetical protein IPG97_16475 [Microthrixaceae bacterium]|nr:hypothetical protein [Microthrixaceae bacterium]